MKTGRTVLVLLNSFYHINQIAIFIYSKEQLSEYKNFQVVTSQNFGTLKTMAYTVKNRKLIFRLCLTNQGCSTVQLAAGIHYMPDLHINHITRRLIHTVTSAHCRTAPAEAIRKCPTSVNPQ